MTITVGWTTDQIIRINKVDMVLVQSTPVEVYELNANTLFFALKDLEAGVEGIPWPDTQSNNSPVTLGGLTFARVLEILDPYTITFEDGQYVVDVVGANTNILDRTNPNQVSVRTNNSAGLVGSRQIENLSFQRDVRIWVDTANGQAGISYPLGLPASPVSNLVDGIAIADARGLPYRFRGVGSATVTSAISLDYFDLLGQSPEVSELVIQAGVSTQATVFERLKLSGTLDGPVLIRECELGDISGYAGEMRDCAWMGNVTVDAARTALISMHNCNSEIPGNSRPYLDFNGASCDAILDRYTGGIELRNITQGQSITINAAAASVRIAASCTSGTIKVRGDFALENLATGNPGLTVLTYENNEDSKYERIEAMWRDQGLDANNAKTITENVEGESYDEQAGGATKEVRKVGTVTTITRQ